MELHPAYLEQEGVAAAGFAVENTVNKTMPPSFIRLLTVSESSSALPYICI